MQIIWSGSVLLSFWLALYLGQLQKVKLTFFPILLIPDNLNTFLYLFENIFQVPQLTISTSMIAPRRYLHIIHCILKVASPALQLR